LVSIVGAGGIGKTTVAIAVAEKAQGYTDGVWLVDFATLRDGSLLPHAINAASRAGFSYKKVSPLLSQTRVKGRKLP
ncbi:hypothetical protein, partial [Rhizobium leguminosarum]|uniref:hypothetical protein n=1 Tax=Rhizobium leguminosarum TaxID=384 RepID=UPI003F9BC9BB